MSNNATITIKRETTEKVEKTISLPSSTPTDEIKKIFETDIIDSEVSNNSTYQPMNNRILLKENIYAREAGCNNCGSIYENIGTSFVVCKLCSRTVKFEKVAERMREFENQHEMANSTTMPILQCNHCNALVKPLEYHECDNSRVISKGRKIEIPTKEIIIKEVPKYQCSTCKEVYIKESSHKCKGNNTEEGFSVIAIAFGIFIAGLLICYLLKLLNRAMEEMD